MWVVLLVACVATAWAVPLQFSGSDTKPVLFDDDLKEWDNKFMRVNKEGRVEAADCSECPQGYHVSRACELTSDTQCAVDECVVPTIYPEFDLTNCKGTISEKSCNLACSSGYDGNPAGFCSSHGAKMDLWGCHDVDECLTDGICGLNTKCTNTEGSYSCACVENHVGQPPKEACLPTCMTLDCKVGYSRKKPVLTCTSGSCEHDFCCKDVDECDGESDPCTKPHTECHNTIGSYTCNCVDKYYKHENDCWPTCPTIKCQAHYGQRAGFDTMRCNAAECAMETCCEPLCSSTTCPHGFKGINQDQHCNDGVWNPAQCCEEYQCVSHDAEGYDLAECSGTLHKSKCSPSCATGFDGQVLVTCPTDGSNFEFSGCDDVDECAQSPCNTNEVCKNTIGSYQCLCKENYVGAPPGQACLPTCATMQCPPSYSAKTPVPICTTGECNVNVCCDDIDECTTKTNPCQAHAKCHNTEGSYECTCVDHYYQHERECFPMCSTHECTGFNTLIPSFESTRCSKSECNDDECCQRKCDTHKCPDGYKRLDNEVCIDFKCTDNTCCHNINECEDNPCGTNAECEDLPGSFKCSCNTGFQGNPPEDTCLLLCSINDCEKGYSLTTPAIRCPDSKCSNNLCCSDINECTATSNPCTDPRATCANNFGGYECPCKPDHYMDGSVCKETCTLAVCPANFVPITKLDTKCKDVECTATECCRPTCAAHTCKDGSTKTNLETPCVGECDDSQCCVSAEGCVAPEIQYFSTLLDETVKAEDAVEFIDAQHIVSSHGSKQYCSRRLNTLATHTNTKLCLNGADKNLGKRFSVTFTEPDGQIDWEFKLPSSAKHVALYLDGVAVTPSESVFSLKSVSRGEHTLVFYQIFGCCETLVGDWQFHRGDGAWDDITTSTLDLACRPPRIQYWSTKISQNQGSQVDNRNWIESHFKTHDTVSGFCTNLQLLSLKHHSNQKLCVAGDAHNVAQRFVINFEEGAGDATWNFRIFLDAEFGHAAYLDGAKVGVAVGGAETAHVYSLKSVSVGKHRLVITSASSCCDRELGSWQFQRNSGAYQDLTTANIDQASRLHETQKSASAAATEFSQIGIEYFSTEMSDQGDAESNKEFIESNYFSGAIAKGYCTKPLANLKQHANENLCSDGSKQNVGQRIAITFFEPVGGVDWKFVIQFSSGWGHSSYLDGQLVLAHTETTSVAHILRAVSAGTHTLVIYSGVECCDEETDAWGFQRADGALTSISLANLEAVEAGNVPSFAYFSTSLTNQGSVEANKDVILRAFASRSSGKGYCTRTLSALNENSNSVLCTEGANRNIGQRFGIKFFEATGGKDWEFEVHLDADLGHIGYLDRKFVNKWSTSPAASGPVVYTLKNVAAGVHEFEVYAGTQCCDKHTSGWRYRRDGGDFQALSADNLATTANPPVPSITYFSAKLENKHSTAAHKAALEEAFSVKRMSYGYCYASLTGLGARRNRDICQNAATTDLGQRISISFFERVGSKWRFDLPVTATWGFSVFLDGKQVADVAEGSTVATSVISVDVEIGAHVLVIYSASSSDGEDVQGPWKFARGESTELLPIGFISLQDAQVCGGNPCGDDATCENDDGNLKCTCNAKYVGSPPKTPCIPTCETWKCTTGYSAIDPRPVCNEPAGCSDTVCCTDVNECTSGADPCTAKNTKCENTDGGYECPCLPGFYQSEKDGCLPTCSKFECTGKTTAVPGKENFHCAGDECTRGECCELLCGTYQCEAHGYQIEDKTRTCDDFDCTDPRCCKDIDECKDSPCGPHASCENIPGSYTCKCEDKYARPDGGLVCKATCATIDCAAGFSKKKDLICSSAPCDPTECCTDIDECDATTDPCSNNSHCVNTEGSYQCICNDNFVQTTTGCKPTCATVTCEHNYVRKSESTVCTDGNCATECCLATCGATSCPDGYTRVSSGMTCSGACPTDQCCTPPAVEVDVGSGTLSVSHTNTKNVDTTGGQYTSPGSFTDLPPENFGYALQVKAPKDALIGLYDSAGNLVYEIAIGASDNTKCEVRASHNGPVLFSVDAVLLKSTEARGFWVTYDGGVLKLGDSATGQTIISFPAPNKDIARLKLASTDQAQWSSISQLQAHERINYFSTALENQGSPVLNKGFIASKYNAQSHGSSEFCSAALSDLTVYSNDKLCKGGASKNVGQRFEIGFKEPVGGISWEIKLALHAEWGYVVDFDGAYLAQGSSQDVTKVIKIDNVAAGAHTIVVYGGDSCCQEAQQSGWQIRRGSYAFKDLSILHIKEQTTHAQVAQVGTHNVVEKFKSTKEIKSVGGGSYVAPPGMPAMPSTQFGYRFQVKASAETKIGVFNYGGRLQFEIVIGANQNTQSYILMPDGSRQGLVSSTELDANQFKSFWLTYDGTTIVVGRGDHGNDILTKATVPNLSTNTVRFGTGSGVNGIFQGVAQLVRTTGLSYMSTRLISNKGSPQKNKEYVEMEHQVSDHGGRGYCSAVLTTLEKHSNPVLCSGGAKENIAKRFAVTFFEPSGSTDWEFKVFTHANYGVSTYLDGALATQLGSSPTADGHLVSLKSVGAGVHTFVVYSGDNCCDDEVHGWLFRRGTGTFEPLTLDRLEKIGY